MIEKNMYYGFPNPIKKGDLVVRCSFWLESECSFKDGDWQLDLIDWNDAYFNMYDHPGMLHDSAWNNYTKDGELEFNPKHETMYKLTFYQIFEDDGFPQIMERFEFEWEEVEDNDSE